MIFGWRCADLDQDYLSEVKEKRSINPSGAGCTFQELMDWNYEDYMVEEV